MSPLSNIAPPPGICIKYYHNGGCKISWGSAHFPRKKWVRVPDFLGCKISCDRFTRLNWNLLTYRKMVGASRVVEVGRVLLVFAACSWPCLPMGEGNQVGPGAATLWIKPPIELYKSSYYKSSYKSSYELNCKPNDDQTAYRAIVCGCQNEMNQHSLVSHVSLFMDGYMTCLKIVCLISKVKS